MAASRSVAASVAEAALGAVLVGAALAAAPFLRARHNR